MRRLVPFVAILVAAGCGGTKTVVRTVTVTRTTTVAQATSTSGDQRWYGHIASVAKWGDGYLLTFDPAWLLSGLTANVEQARVQKLVCAPLACPPVANDNFTLDETPGTIVFQLPAATKGTVLTSGDNLNGTPVSATQLAAIVAGRSSLKLFEPLDSGVWLTVHVDTVTAFQQQYKP